MSLSCLAPRVRAPSPRPHPGPRRHNPAAGAENAAPTGAVDGFAAHRLGAPKVAVLLNTRARQVTPEVASTFERLVGAPHAYRSHSLAEAQRHIDTIAAAGYDTVVCCGGDGTLVTAINMMRAGTARHGMPMPRFAQLALGTGNALRRVVHAADPTDDLRNIRAGTTAERKLSLIEDQDGTAFFFAGIGHDALLMHDYDRMQHHVPQCMSRNLMRSKFGFTTALFTRTLGRTLRSRNQGHAVITASGPCYRIDRTRGDALVAVPPGEIFSGPVGMVAVGTVPCLGYDIRMFPFAEARPNMMHLRISQMSVFGMMFRGGALWRGTFKHDRLCHDFLVTAVDVALDRPLHYQHSGETQGRIRHARFGVLPGAVTMAAQRRS